MSNDLQWYLIRNYNSYLVKKVPEGPIFSREPGNLRNLHSYKYSGLVNKKAIDISDTGNGIKITTRKTGASSQAVRGALTSSTIRNRAGSRRVIGIAAGLTKRGYRTDLRQAALGRASALAEAQKEKKNPPQKKIRGKYKAGAAAGPA